MDVLLPILIIAFLILLNGLFVAAEFAIIGVRPSRLEQLAQEGNRTAIGVRKVVRDNVRQDRYIATAQLGITVASLGLGMYGEPVIAHWLEIPLEEWVGITNPNLLHTISFIIALSIMTYFHVVVGEMIPKSLALQAAERTALVLNRPMQLIQRVFSPAVTTLNQIGMLVLRLMRVPIPDAQSRIHTPGELELIVSESVASGMLDEGEQQLIERIFDFGERRVWQVMTPRREIEAIPIDLPSDQLLSVMSESTHSRLPVYEGDLDNILGVLHLKDLVRKSLSNEEIDLRSLIRNISAVPESIHVENLLNAMRRGRQHLAIVIDEYGGTEGIVTLEDLVEEIVGEVRDEFDEEEEAPFSIPEPSHVVFRGNYPLADAIQRFPLGDLSEYDAETVSGILLAHLNRPPKVGDEVTINDVTYHVDEVDGLAIISLSIFLPDDTLDEPADLP